MTYGLMLFANHKRDRMEEAVSPSAELVRGDFPVGMKASSSALRAPRIKSGAGSSPQGEKGRCSHRGATVSWMMAFASILRGACQIRSTGKS